MLHNTGHLKWSTNTALKVCVQCVCVCVCVCTVVWTKVGHWSLWKSLTFTSNMFLCLISDVMFLLVQTTPVREGKLTSKEQDITSMSAKKCLGRNWMKTREIVGISNPQSTLKQACSIHIPADQTEHYQIFFWSVFYQNFLLAINVSHDKQ